MNNDRRRRIKTVIDAIETNADIIGSIRDEEEEAMENLPDGIKDSDRYTAMENAAECLESAGQALEEAVRHLEEAMT